MLLADPSRLASAEYQAFAVLTMCRAWYALERGAVVSKPAAARWALGRAGGRWDSLVDAATAWQPGGELDRLDEVLTMIGFAVRLSEEVYGSPSDRHP